MGSCISLSVTRRCYRPNDAISVTYDMEKATYTKGSCWIGLIPSHITSDDEYVNDNHDVDYFHVYQDRGEGTLRTSRAGTYKIKCFANDNGGKELPHFCVSDIIVGRDRPYISAGATTYKPNENISISYDLSNCNYSSGSCWIGLIPSHITSTSEITNDQYHVCRFHVSQNVGKGTLRTSKPGRYRIKCFADDNEGKLLYEGEDIITVQDDDEKKIEDELASIKQNPGKSRHELYELAKKTYKKKGKPVVIDTKDAISDVRQNAANYKNVALPMTLAMDKDFSTWNEQSFKRDFAIKFHIPIECIKVVSVRAGSIIADVELHTHWKDKDGHQKSMAIKVIADKVDPVVAKKAFAEFAVFAVEFKPPKAGFDCTRRQVIMNPKWNKTYGPGATNWDGALSDGKDRGGEPYYCPKGWKRFSIQFKESALDFANVYDKWPIAYHGTKFDFSMMITLSGLKCFPGAYGCGVYMSPSINYCAHDRYAKAVKLDFSKYEAIKNDWSSDHAAEFRKYDGKWVQCAFALRVKPGSYTKNRDTMNLKQDPYDGIKRDEIIWCVNGKREEIITDDKILIYGIMIKVSDTKPTGHVYN